MSTIRVLPPKVAERIAAGEVVERPASVVKELIENALDAGATAIQVEVTGGGAGLIRVSDNGCGMSRAAAPLALQRFSTSKICALADLDAIRSLGFRGEALAAMVAVARVRLLTRTADELQGTCVTASGTDLQVEPAASPGGCSVAVSDLFYNTPARRKFLKSSLRETELCQESVVHYALAYPEVAFKLTIDGRERLLAPPATALERLALVVGREAAGDLLPITWDAGDLRLRGLISSPALGRSRRDRQYFSVNRRPIRSGLLAVMLERPYAGRLPPGRYPLAAIQIELDPSLVDVNVHPRKAEVRFAQERTIYQALSQAVGQALSSFPLQDAGLFGLAGGPLGLSGWPFPETPLAAAAIAEGGAAYEPQPGMVALGQVRNTYIVAHTFDALVIVDQHAAHEVILAERLLAARASLPLAAPLRLDLTAREAELLSGCLDILAELGLGLEPFGGHSFLVRTLPVPLVDQDPPALLAELLAELSAKAAAGRSLEAGALRERLVSRAACLAAVKAGDVLPRQAQQALLDDLLAVWSPSNCPHGRPTLFTLTIEEMERRFLRR